MKRGFTLIEVVVALVLLEIGVLAALAMITSAGRRMSEAERLERAVASMEEVADSLFGTAAPPAKGHRALPGGVLVVWEPGGPRYRISALHGPDTLVTLALP